MTLCILTSCCHPNTHVSVSNVTPQSRFVDLIANIKYLSAFAAFKYIIVVDPTLDKNQTFLDQLVDLIYDLNSTKNYPQIFFTIAQFNEHDQIQIQTRGKGYSEALLLEHAINFALANNLHFDHCLKISARYKILNLNYFLSSFRQGVGKYDIWCNAQPSSSQACTIFYFFNKSMSDKVCNLLVHVDDSRMNFIEHAFYDKICMNSFVNVKYLFPAIYDFNLLSGSYNAKYGLLRQLKRYASLLIG